MIATAEAFKPYEIARANEFNGDEFHLHRLLQPASEGLPKIEIELFRLGVYGSNPRIRHFFSVHTVDSRTHTLLAAHFYLKKDSAFDGFIPNGDSEKPNTDPSMTLFHGTESLAVPSPYYAVFYGGNDPTRARIISVSLLENREYGNGGSGQEQITEFDPENGDRGLYEAFLEETGLPEVADLPETMRIYLECQFKKDGQMIPLTPETLARRIIMASG